MYRRDFHFTGRRVSFPPVSSSHHVTVRDKSKFNEKMPASFDYRGRIFVRGEATMSEETTIAERLLTSRR